MGTAIAHGTALILADPTQRVALYSTMCAAIAECARVDEVQEIRHRAKALEEYTRQSKNFEAEVQLSAIRLRAERRAGELLIEMAENGERHDDQGSNKKVFPNGTPSSLAELNIDRKDSMQWQQLAKIPGADFEAALAEPGVKRTRKVLAARRPKQPAKKAAKQKRRHSEDNSARSRRLVCEAALKIADGKVYSAQQICEVVGRKETCAFMERARMLPWLAIERLPDGFRFTVDEELRAVCEDHAPRPQLSGAGVHAFINRLTKEIYRRRKENNEKNKAIKWNPDNTLKTEQKRLLDWIEAELATLSELMASPGPDFMSAASRA